MTVLRQVTGEEEKAAYEMVVEPILPNWGQNLEWLGSEEEVRKQDSEDNSRKHWGSCEE